MAIVAVRTAPHPETGRVGEVPAIVLPDGTTRRLDLRHADRRNHLMLPPVASAIPVIPRQEWPALIAAQSKADAVWTPVLDQGPHGSCFPGPTRVRMADGTDRAIRDVEAGEAVVTHLGRARPVTRVWRRAYSGPMVRLTYRLMGDARSLACTPEHPVYSLPRSGAAPPAFRPASEFVAGDRTLLPGDPAEGPGRHALRAFVPFESVEPVGAVETVFNLAVAEDESYVAEGVAVHNCTGHGSAGLLMFSRALRGMAHVPLSPTYPYAHCNGGFDAGAVGSTVMDFLATSGTCTFDLCGEDAIFLRRIPDRAAADASAARFRFGDLAAPRTFDEMATVLLVDGGLAYGLQVGAAFNRVDPTTLVTRCGYGPGNHWVYGRRLVRLADGQYGIRTRNSWGAGWGVGGECVILEQDIMNYGDQPDAVGVLSVLPDPTAASEVPPPAA